ncbi:glycoside hydrolase family 97 C-terminal domain-containing protein [Longitalea arenae]|uniref:glycoside hydrolase family 97 C-terminal domain-containing protein n=1 Tax=Longitalea arenae TaxID=2812558 RepID=UPI0019677CF2|nr:glycoside hydrolase family 97 C-terminal domain-containing protein [Longitalea arenae]
MARRKGNDWYIGSINGEQKEKRKIINFDFLPDGVKYKLTLIADGKHDKALQRNTWLWTEQLPLM